jgi:hypothetical protein
MSLDTCKLENVRIRTDRIMARCPACAESGHDRSGEHLIIDAEGRFACVVYPGDSPDAKKHRKRIFALCGNRGAQPLCVRPAGGLGRLGRVVESPLATKPLRTGILGRSRKIEEDVSPIG